MATHSLGCSTLTFGLLSVGEPSFLTRTGSSAPLAGVVFAFLLGVSASVHDSLAELDAVDWVLFRFRNEEVMDLVD